MGILSLNILEQTKLWTLHQKLLTRLLFNLINPMAIVFVLEPKETLLLERYISLLCTLFSIACAFNDDFWYPNPRQRAFVILFHVSEIKLNSIPTKWFALVLFFAWRTVVFCDKHSNLLKARRDLYALLLYNNSIFQWSHWDL